MIAAPQPNSSWWIYTGTALLYTALTFRGELPRSEALIFSKDNDRTLTSILTIHAVFLGVLLATIWIARNLLPVLPSWLTATFNFYRGVPLSGLELIFVFGGIALHYIERRFLYVAIGKSAGLQESGSEP